MKKIRIFIASSVNELRAERAELGKFITGINNKTVDHDIYCELVLCENEDGAMSSGDRKQDEYNEIIKTCDAVFVLFGSRAGRYTLEELDLAHACFKERGKPKVYTYFKDFDIEGLNDELRLAYKKITEEYQHYFGTFENIATVQVELLRVLYDITLNDSFRVHEQGGKIYFGSDLIMNTDELDYVKACSSIKSLKEKIAGLRSGDEKYTEGLFGDEIFDEIESCEKRLFERYNSCFSALEARYKSMTLASGFDPELQAAYNASAKGDFAQVLNILKPEKLRLETEKAVLEAESTRREYYETTFNKYLQLINALVIRDDIDTLGDTYTKVIDAIKGLHLYELDPLCLGVWYDYALFLRDMGRWDEAISCGMELDRIFLSLDTAKDNGTEYTTFDNNKLHLLNLLGTVCYEANMPKEAEEYFLRANKLLDSYGGDTGEIRLNDIAGIYDTLGFFYYSQGQLRRAEDFLIKSTELYRDLVLNYDGYPTRDFSMACNNIAMLYRDKGDFKNAEKYLLEAISLFSENGKNQPPEEYNFLANVYNNIGVLYKEQGQMQKAEEFMLSAIAAREELTSKNPVRFSCDLAYCYNNIGNFYEENGNLDGALEFLDKAIDICQRYGKEYPEKFQYITAVAYSNKSQLYQLLGDHDTADDFISVAIKLYRELTAKNPERYCGDLASLYTNAGLISQYRGNFEAAEAFLKEALNSHKQLSLQSPEKYTLSLIIDYNSIGSFYMSQNKKEEAERHLLSGLELAKAATRENPNRFTGYLALTYFNLGSLNEDDECLRAAYELAKKSDHGPYSKSIIYTLKDRFEE